MKIVNCKIVNSRSGFTLIEVLITVAIITAVSLFGYLAFSKFKGSQAVELTMNELAAVIKETQKRSVTQQDGKQWGIRFGNSSSSYEVFSGSSYATSSVSRTYYLGRNTLFGNPATSTIDAIFSAISGKLSETRVVSLVNTKKDGVVGDIVLTSRGTITTRKDTGLVGYWHFDEGTATTTYDASGFANTGTATGTTWVAASSCKSGQCLSFDGTDDYVSVADDPNLDISSNVTIAAWVKLDVLKNYNFILAKGFDGSENYELYVNVSGTVAGEWLFAGGRASCVNSGATVLTAGSWNHLAVTFDGSQCKTYVNGALANTVSASSATITTNARPLIVGAEESSSGGFMSGRFTDGLIDEVHLYNRALSVTEISNLYNDLK